MLLNVKDRLAIVSILPKEGSIDVLKIISALIEKIKLTEEEIKAINLENKEGILHWNNEVEPVLEVSISDQEVDLLKQIVKGLDSEKKLPISYLEIAEKIIQM